MFKFSRHINLSTTEFTAKYCNKKASHRLVETILPACIYSCFLSFHHFSAKAKNGQIFIASYVILPFKPFLHSNQESRHIKPLHFERNFNSNANKRRKGKGCSCSLDILNKKCTHTLNNVFNLSYNRKRLDIFRSSNTSIHFSYMFRAQMKTIKLCT